MQDNCKTHATGADVALWWCCCAMQVPAPVGDTCIRCCSCRQLRWVTRSVAVLLRSIQTNKPWCHAVALQDPVVQRATAGTAVAAAGAHVRRSTENWKAPF
jgi:hypothetical protein